jgi:nucleoid-associated protein YgaU
MTEHTKYTGTLPTTHTVVHGDTLSALAQRYGTTVKAIFDANQDVMKDPDSLPVETGPFDAHGKGHAVVLTIPA